MSDKSTELLAVPFVLREMQMKTPMKLQYLFSTSANINPNQLNKWTKRPQIQHEGNRWTTRSFIYYWQKMPEVSSSACESSSTSPYDIKQKLTMWCRNFADIYNETEAHVYTNTLYFSHGSDSGVQYLLTEVYLVSKWWHSQLIDY